MRPADVSTREHLGYLRWNPNMIPESRQLALNPDTLHKLQAIMLLKNPVELVSTPSLSKKNDRPASLPSADGSATHAIALKKAKRRQSVIVSSYENKIRVALPFQDILNQLQDSQTANLYEEYSKAIDDALASVKLQILSENEKLRSQNSSENLELMFAYTEAGWCVFGVLLTIVGSGMSILTRYTDNSIESPVLIDELFAFLLVLMLLQLFIRAAMIAFAFVNNSKPSFPYEDEYRNYIRQNIEKGNYSVIAWKAMGEQLIAPQIKTRLFNDRIVYKNETKI